MRLLIRALSLGAVASAHAQWSWMYRKQELPLRVDPTRIAVQLDGSAPSRQNLDPTAAAIEAVGVGWTTQRVPTVLSGRSRVDWIEARLERPAGERFVSPVFLDPMGGSVVPTREIHVRFAPGVSDARARALLATLAAGAAIESYGARLPGLYRVRTAFRNGAAVLDATLLLGRRPDVLFAEPDFMFTGSGASTPPNDPLFPRQWALNNTGQAGGGTGAIGQDLRALAAWQVTGGNRSVRTVVLDTGIQQDHPDLRQLPGRDFVTSVPGGGPFSDWDRHGTPVAGVISGIWNNRIGIAGIAPETVVMSARFARTTSSSGSWSAWPSATVNALLWAEQQGVRVSNNSNSYGMPSAAIDDAYTATRSRGMVHFASAGNRSSTVISYPARIPAVNAVAALNSLGTRAGFSNFGPGLDFSAPGSGIWSTDRTGPLGYAGGDYAGVSGTSFAAPYAAGVAALVLSVNRHLFAPDVERVMAETARDMAAAGYDTDSGWGALNADAAVRRAQQIQIAGSFRFGDRLANPPLRGTFSYRFPSGAAWTTESFSLNPSLAFGNVRAPYGPFQLSVKVGTFLRRTITVDNTSGNRADVSLELVNGDVNNDNVINTADEARIVRAMGSRPGLAGWDANADLDGDGVVGESDLAIYARNAGRTGDR